MKRYFLFSWSDYEAIGGWNDFHLDYEDAYEAIQTGERLVEKTPPHVADKYHVVDSVTGKIVKQNYEAI
jgi:hypothetical protein